MKTLQAGSSLSAIPEQIRVKLLNNNLGILVTVPEIKLDLMNIGMHYTIQDSPQSQVPAYLSPNFVVSKGKPAYSAGCDYSGSQGLWWGSTSCS